MSAVVESTAKEANGERSGPRGPRKNGGGKGRARGGPRGKKQAPGGGEGEGGKGRRNPSVGEDGVTKRGSVARESDVKAVAGYVANALRTDGVVELLAAGPPSVNRAVKAVCLARNYLEDDGVDLVVDPAFLGTEELPASNETVLTVRSVPRAHKADGDGGAAAAPADQATVEFNVAGNSVPTAVAGAVAKAVRKGETVVAYAMGAQAVTRGFKAMWKAKTYLAEEDVQIFVRPEFCKPEPGDTYSTKIAFKCLLGPIEAAAPVPKADADAAPETAEDDN